MFSMYFPRYAMVLYCIWTYKKSFKTDFLRNIHNSAYICFFIHASFWSKHTVFSKTCNVGEHSKCSVGILRKEHCCGVRKYVGYLSVYVFGIDLHSLFVYYFSHNIQTNTLLPTEAARDKWDPAVVKHFPRHVSQIRTCRLTQQHIPRLQHCFIAAYLKKLPSAAYKYSARINEFAYVFAYNTDFVMHLMLTAGLSQCTFQRILQIVQ